MRVVRHQYPGIAADFRLGDQAVQAIYKIFPVRLIAEYIGRPHIVLNYVYAHF